MLGASEAGIEGEGAAAADEEADGQRDEGEDVFHAGREEKRAAVDRDECDYHGDGAGQRAEAREQAEDEQNSAEKFAAAGESGPEDSRHHPEFLGKEAASGLKAVAAEPAEQLLGAVGEHDHAEHEARRKRSPIAGVSVTELHNPCF